jgi:TonB family protein
MVALTVLTVLVMRPSVAALATAPQQSPAAAMQSTSDTPWPPAGVYRPANGVTPPRLVKAGRPDYTADAMREKIQGSVKLEVVIKSDGTVGEARIVRSLDRKYGLDDAAMKSLKDYRFAPAMKDGVAVPVLVSMEISFTTPK